MPSSGKIKKQISKKKKSLNKEKLDVPSAKEMKKILDKMFQYWKKSP